MSRTVARQRTDARRQLSRLREFIAKELPQKIGNSFDPKIENDSLGLLALLLFVDKRWRNISGRDQDRMHRWLVGSAAGNVREVLNWTIALKTSPEVVSFLESLRRWIDASPVDVFERVFAAFEPSERRRHGYYCTPSPLARFVVERAHRTLVVELGLRDGILAKEIVDADSRPTGNRESPPHPFNILDPAVGSGAFLRAIIKIAWLHFQRHRNRRSSPTDWSATASENLLPRLFACDVQFAPLVGAHVELATSLLKSGFDFAQPVALSLWHINPLDTLDDSGHPESKAAQDTAEPLQRFRSTQFSLIVGNPPYGAHQAIASSAMRRLMHGQRPGAGGNADYFHSANGPINERKTWLYDHYIQFLRFAHWRIEKAGAGTIAFLTNRGFLEHVTMRGLRHQWLQSFNRIEIHDFQGGDDRSNRDHGSIHENVFGVRSGIALSVLTKSFHPAGARAIDLHLHTGSAQSKLRGLRGANLSLKRKRWIPRAPNFSFQLESNRPLSLSSALIPLDECFTLKSSAIVTARDSLVIGFTPAELLAQIEQLRDSRIGDNELRERFFRKSRSPKYPRGDTRSWKLADARKRLAADSNGQVYVQKCSYRPLDDRYIYWHPQMVDWRRMAVSQLMMRGDNPALIARRQMPSDVAANYFWITRWPTIDGILRSDNRGNEYIFPLMNSTSGPFYNFSEQLMEAVTRRLRVVFDWSPVRPNDDFSRSHDKAAPLNGCDLFAFIVAVVFSPSYRSAQQAAMRRDFISIALPASEEFFRKLAGDGRGLIQTIGWHDCGSSEESKLDQQSSDVAILKPRFVNRQIHLGEQVIADGVSHSVWRHRAGAHQVCEKWLGDRVGRKLTTSTLQQFSIVRQVIERLQSITDSIESTVSAFGGWNRILR